MDISTCVELGLCSELRWFLLFANGAFSRWLAELFFESAPTGEGVVGRERPPAKTASTPVGKGNSAALFCVWLVNGGFDPSIVGVLVAIGTVGGAASPTSLVDNDGAAAAEDAIGGVEIESTNGTSTSMSIGVGISIDDGACGSGA
jgi:hypothetical protein